MKLFQFETHCHTAESSPCGILTGAEVAEGMKQAGYAGTFITDHFYSRFFKKRGIENADWQVQANEYLAGYRAAKKRGEQLGIKVFLGLEAQPEDSPFEFLVYGPDEQFIIDNGPFYNLSTPDFYSFMHENGFLVFQAHPYRFGLSPENPKYFDGIEIVNSQPRNQSRNKLALAFAASNNTLTIAGGDVHMKGDIGRCGIMLPDSINSTKDFIDYYKEVKTPELIITYGV